MLGAEIRKARLAAGLTQQQLAAKAGISREYVSQLERSRYSPTVEIVLRLCKAMDVKAWTIIRRIEASRLTKPTAK